MKWKQVGEEEWKSPHLGVFPPTHLCQYTLSYSCFGATCFDCENGPICVSGLLTRPARLPVDNSDGHGPFSRLCIFPGPGTAAWPASTSHVCSAPAILLTWSNPTADQRKSDLSFELPRAASLATNQVDHLFRPPFCAGVSSRTSPLPRVPVLFIKSAIATPSSPPSSLFLFSCALSTLLHLALPCSSVCHSTGAYSIQLVNEEVLSQVGFTSK